ncbi:MAG: site-specific integrase, partial [Proteobacteria bacterium]|nr:site-specific integrase [Pseudomonadota bacterium]MBU1738535.1 site-specific integrase [Pseudomonadota bacterium]
FSDEIFWILVILHQGIEQVVGYGHWFLLWLLFVTGRGHLHKIFYRLDPLARLKLPRKQKFRVRPFNFAEWDRLIEHIPEWYRPYFQFAVRTGLRPSEQVALKWIAIDDEYIHIELSRVGNEEKTELKTEASRRMIPLRPDLVKILEDQKKVTKGQKSEYVFLNMDGNVINQTNLSLVWKLALEKSGLPSRRMYETRHTFASWAMTLGESPEWVARVLGHVDTSMVYRTYSRYIPNLTKEDGLSFGNQFWKS